jgi:F0F1-type ATP synthase alpha subunit
LRKIEEDKDFDEKDEEKFKEAINEFKKKFIYVE